MRQFLAAFALVIGLIATPVMASEDVLIAHDAYAFQTAPSQRNGAAFMELRGLSKDLTLTHASSDIAQRVEIHSMSMEDGIMEMRRLDALTIPAGETITLEPSGYHIMFIGLKSPLEKDANFPLTLHFANGTAQTVTVNIVAPGAKPSGHGHHHHH